ncbi:MAG: 4-hydroxythreonine-4-phosphate dehydrogenase PdxA, partial [Pseudomonas sp.]|nr:4-hydroxythreonine-4-phosphate dehydrogenase PdxA [Pseudomonas sp.]
MRLAHAPRDFDLVVFADARVLRAAAAAIGLSLTLTERDGASPGALALVDTPHPLVPAFGAPEADNAASVVGALHAAATGCVDGAFDGLVTGPVHKATINDGGIAYTGTTELLAAHAGRDVVMMLANDIVRVALVTTHLPLREVADAITADAAERTLRITAAALRDDFGIDDPTVAVLGLNPHAGEAGHLGREELDIIEPLLARLRGEGLRLVGPLPADTAFLPAKLRGFDAVVAMYHDQGLPVLKYSGFEHAV